ncbi:hypothetical protein O9X98_05255 [Agrobacterium salinitolerans]|nr:hypothetical protein [Agrobacterium salinitolerans]
MTTVALTPYDGATRKGADQIRSTLTDAAAKSRAALEAAIRDNGETASDVYHPAERAFQADWARQAERRTWWKKSNILDVKIGTAAYLVLPLVLSVASCAALHDRTSANPVGGAIFFAALALAAALIGAIPYAKVLHKFLLARSLGHIDDFTRWNSLRMHLAWALTDKAVYTVTRDPKTETLTVNRIPLDEVQACAFREFEGTAFSEIYSNAGNFFTILDPASEKVSGAKNVVDLINARVPKK